MKNKIVLTLIVLFACAGLYSQTANDYLNMVKTKLKEGNCESAQRCYNVYKQLSNKTDVFVETQIKNCNDGIKYQDENQYDDDSDENVYVVVDKMPEFPGGDDEMSRWLSKNIQYPEFAIVNNIQGRVVCQFVINKDGKITDIQVVRGVEASLDAEAVRVIRLMPNWTPGRKDGKNVKVRYTLPIRFKL